MSGTSLDGVDLVIVDFANEKPRLVAASLLPFPDSLRAELLELCQPGDDEIDRLGRADTALGLFIGAGLRDLLAEKGIERGRIRALGSHGQTVRHRPQRPHPFTLQIGDPNVIAELAGVPVVADFRRRDLAAGGQGAPLVPAFHAAVFGSSNDRVVVNIGGMANITLLPGGRPDAASGFDTGPGNVLLDAWAQRHLGTPIDEDGAWAAQATPDPALLARLLADPYFAQPPPKSTGREYFNLAWLQAHLNHSLAPASIQATLTELTAATIARGIAMAQQMRPKSVLVCGGGRRNGWLMNRLAAALPDVTVTTTDSHGLDGDWVEATAFAWLARQRLMGLAGNLAAVTGAAGPRVLGAIYSA